MNEVLWTFSFRGCVDSVCCREVMVIFFNCVLSFLSIVFFFI